MQLSGHQSTGKAIKRIIFCHL